MSKPRDHDDLNVFRDSMKDVTPLKPENRVILRAKKTKAKPVPSPIASPQAMRDGHRQIHEANSVQSETIIHFERPGLQHKILRKLKQGQFSIEARLDLHGLTIAQAEKTLEAFITHCQQHGLRHVCIIHGKGRRNDQASVLKSAVNQWLREQTEILAFHSAKPADGGAGAVYVLLRTYKENKEKKL